MPKWNNVEPVKSLEDNLYTEGEIMGYHRCENCGKMFTFGMCNTRAIASVRNAAPKWEQPKKKKNTGKQGKSKCGTVDCFYSRALKTKEIATIEQPIFFLVKRSKNNTFTKVTVLNALSRKHSNFATLYADTSKTVLHALGEMMYMTWITIRTFNSH